MASRLTIQELRDLLERPLYGDALVSISVQLTFGGVVFDTMGTAKLAAEGIRLTFPGIESLEKLAGACRNKTELKWLEIEDGRIYLIRDACPVQMVRSLPWLRSQHRHALYLEGFSTSPPGFPAGNTSSKPYVAVLFHKHFMTIEEMLERQTFQVLCQGCKTVERGSAFAFRDRNGNLGFGTAKHVLDGTEKHTLLLRRPGEDPFAVRPIASTSHDVARLEPLAPFGDELDGLALGSASRCELSDRVYVAGYPARLGERPTISLGHVSKLNADYNGEHGLLQIGSAAVNPNNSGGPVCDSEGRVIGILTTRQNSGQNLHNIAFAEPIDRLPEA